MPESLIYRHHPNGSIGLWAFGGAVLALVAGMVALVLHGPDPRVQAGPVGVALSVLLLGAVVGIGVRTLLMPIVTVAIGDRRIVVTRRWLWKRQISEHAAADLIPAMCTSTFDSDEADPAKNTRFSAVLHVPDVGAITLARSLDAAAVQQACDRFNRKLFGDLQAARRNFPKL